MQKIPYQTAVVDNVKVSYQYGGKDGAPVLLFFHGLEMQEMWIPYAEELGKKYRFLIYEYPFHTADADEQIDFAAKLLKALSIEKVILIGASDGGVYAQIFAKRHPESVLTMILTTTLTIDSDYVRDIRKERFIHSFKCVYMLKDYPVFKESDLEYLRGKIQVLLPEKDMFKKEDQERLAELFRKLDAEILSVPGGHVGFIVQSEYYIDLMEKFLEKNVI